MTGKGVPSAEVTAAKWQGERPEQAGNKPDLYLSAWARGLAAKKRRGRQAGRYRTGQKNTRQGRSVGGPEPEFWTGWLSRAGAGRGTQLGLGVTGSFQFRCVCGSFGGWPGPAWAHPPPTPGRPAGRPASLTFTTYLNWQGRTGRTGPGQPAGRTGQGARLARPDRLASWRVRVCEGGKPARRPTGPPALAIWHTPTGQWCDNMSHLAGLGDSGTWLDWCGQLARESSRTYGIRGIGSN